jgi:hypothetical protein
MTLHPASELAPSPKHLVPRSPSPTISVKNSGTEPSTSKPDCLSPGLGIELMELPMTRFSLANDPTFEAYYRAPHGGKSALADVKPWKHKQKLRWGGMRLRIKQATLCQCCGGSPYTPTDAAGYRVCGYCRGQVIEMRAKMLFREYAENAEAGAA